MENYHKVCEFNIIYNEDDVQCDNDFTTGAAPTCLSQQIGCTVTPEQVQTKTGTIKLHKVAF